MYHQRYLAVFACLVTFVFAEHAVTAESIALPEQPQEVASTEGARQNLLPSDVFESDHNGQLAGGWRSAQHSSNFSYEFGADEGVLVVTRIGAEPWGRVAQELDARPYVGKTLEFSAELAGDFTLEYGEAFEPSGLGVEVKAVHENLRMRMMGPQIFSSSADWEVGEGAYKWTPLSIRFEVPPNATTLQLVIKMTMGGELRARNPGLQLVQEQ